MIVKFFSISDPETLGSQSIPCYAIRIAGESPAERQVLEGTPGGALPGVVLLARLDGTEANYSPFDWQTGGRAMRVAHQHIADHWFDLGSGSTIDASSVLAPAGQVGNVRSGRA